MILIHEYIYAVIILNMLVYIYTITAFVSILILFNQSTLISTSQFGNINSIRFIKSSLVFVIFTLAGVPPTIGFLSKLLSCILIFNNNSIVFISIFLFINFFMLYFYIQQLLYLVTTKHNKEQYLWYRYAVYLDSTLLYNILLFMVLNLFGIFLLYDIYLYLLLINSYINI